jgi:(heptosyl)LPS beta-1,4-glucosyltransferase
VSAPLELSVLITTYNEAEMLPLCLDPIEGWADEIVVVDSGSTDGTIEIAQAAGAVVRHHPYESPARQKNWGLTQCRYPWVLILDADEVVSPELRTEIEQVLRRGPQADGYWIGRDNLFLGRWVRHGGWESDAVIRLVHRDRARYDDRLVHEEIDLPGPLPKLAGRLRHHTFRSFEQYWPKVRRYAHHGALQAFQRGRRASAWSVLLHTVGRFTKMYLLRRGFLDGGHGLVLALFSSFTTYLKYAHLWELTRQQPDAPRNRS